MNKMVMAIVLASCGIVFLLRPMWIWKWHTFMWVKGGEPTEASKALIFAEGLLMISFAIVLALFVRD